MRPATQRFIDLREAPGVYLLVDLDEKPLYAGRSDKIRKRMRQHFIRQDSSVTSDGLLDLFEVLRVYVWYCSRDEIHALEAALHSEFTPPWNRALVSVDEEARVLRLDTADVVIDMIDTPEELALRRESLERIEAKLLHLLRGVRKAKISGTSPGIYSALLHHADELGALFERNDTDAAI